MMDHRNNEFEYQEIHKAKASSKFNRSKTIHSPRNSKEFPEKTLYLYPSPPSIERNGSIKKLHCSPLGSMVGNSFKGKVKKLYSIFDSRKDSSPRPSIPKPQSKNNSKSLVSHSSHVLLPGTEDRVVIYLTSIRGIRRTFEDCYTVKMIIGSYRLVVDERDVSMHIAYRKELQSILGEKNVTLPQVFIKGKHIGGAEVIKQLNEIGELPKLLRGLPLRPIGYICEGCGDVRFLPCTNCDGSRNFFDEDEGQIKRCHLCNENGLVLCSLCCS